jgi:uncharacterized coiled-coil DUF342 family protein
MELNLREEVQELMRASETLIEHIQNKVLTVEECTAVAECVKKLEKKLLPDRHQK